MRFENKYVNKFWRFSTSFNLGIPVMVAITLLITWGTIVESYYNDAFAAQQLVYRSWMMYVSMGLLVYNLAAVMIDRWPWKNKHVPFLLVHLGIITLIFGGWVTQKFGLDGNMLININSQSNHVSVGQTDFVVYATMDGDRYTKYYDQEVDFFRKPPTEQKPFQVDLSDKKIIVDQYVKYARISKKLVKSQDESAGASIKFQLQNPNVKQVEVLTQPSKNKSADINLGPLKLYMGHVVAKSGRRALEANEVYFNAIDNEYIQFDLYKIADLKPYKSGKIKIGDVVQTNWMGLELRLLDYVPQAVEDWDVVPVEKSTPLTTSAVRIRFGQKTQWILLNDVIKLFDSNAAYLVSYQNRRIDLGFPVFLKNFEMIMYEGTQRAKSYASHVLVKSPQLVVPLEAEIAMNEPLKFGGYTFYQASYNQDERTGEPTATVLSVNYDPGRWIKYLGSLILSVGIIWLFVQTRKRKTAQL
ncbi:MAG: cytochrome c biogenesis protein ResB [Pseudobdellovibrio sp.]